MSARRQIIAALSEDSLGGIATLHDVAHAEQLVDAHRTEVIAKAIGRLRAIPITCTALTGPVWYGDGWNSAITVLEEIAEYQTPDDEAYPGELQRLRALVLGLRVAALRKEDMAQVQWLLTDHEETREKATDAQSATATPGPTGRLAQLLDAIRTHRGEWTTKRVQDLYRLSPLSPPNAPEGRLRHVARGDLRDLHTWGYLVLHEDTGRRFYTLATRKDSRS
jgi:hypothetical protein